MGSHTMFSIEEILVYRGFTFTLLLVLGKTYKWSHVYKTAVPHINNSALCIWNEKFIESMLVLILDFSKVWASVL